MTKKSSHFLAKAFPLFLAIFIDSMGLGLLFPILNTLFIGTGSNFLPVDTSMQTRNFLFGLTVSIFMLSWFFGAAYLGDLSDAIGRKKSLIIALIGAFLGYLISAFGVNAGSIALLILGRIIAGFTSGSQSIAQAAIIDISEPDLKARNIGLILLFSSLGFVFGPMCGAFFSSHQIYEGFNLSTPLYFAAIISLFNALLLLWLFKETFKARAKIHLKIHRAIEIFISAFKHHRVRYLSFVFLLMLLGWGCFYSFISLFLTKQLDFTSTQVNLFMVLLATGFGLGCGFFVNWITHHLSIKQSIISMIILSGAISLVTVSFSQGWLMWFIATPVGVAISVPYSMMIAVFSNQVDENSQGWVMGITGAISSLAFAIAGFGGGFLANHSPGLPISCGGLFLIASGIAMMYSRAKTHQ